MKVQARPDNGIIQVALNTPEGRVRISTGTRSQREAQALVREAGLADLEKMTAGGQLAQRALVALTQTRHLTLESARDEWLDTMAVCGQSHLTLEKNRIELNAWFTASPAVARRRPDQLRETDVNAWINRPGRGGLANRQRRLSVLRSFCRFLVARGYAVANPAANVRVNVRDLKHEQKESRPVLAFTPAEIRQLRAKLEPGFWRDAVDLAWATGLRIGDVVQLEWATLSVPGHIVVWHEKTRERVCLPINEKITPGLADVITRLVPNDSRFVFPEEQRRFTFDKSNRDRYSVHFGRLVARAGIMGKTFHSLRRARLQAWEAAGFSLDECRRFAGHKHERTTKRYLRART